MSSNSDDIRKSPFHSSYRSIRRASKHIDDLDSSLAGFNADGQAYNIVREDYGDGSQYVVKAQLAKEIPGEIESIAIDAVYNLRASLDQAVYGVAHLAKEAGNGGIDLSSNKIKFPVAKEKSKMEGGIERLTDLEGVPEGIGALIRDMRPHLEDMAAEEERLIYALNKLANINKHRFLSDTDIRTKHFVIEHVSGPSPFDHPSLKFFQVGGGGSTITAVPAEAPVKKNEIGLYVSRYTPETYCNVQVSIDIHFSDAIGLQKRTCTFQLRAMSEICTKFVNECHDLCKASGILV